MSSKFDFSYGQKDLEEVLNVLRKSKRAIEALSSNSGEELAKKFSSQTESSEEFDDIYNFFVDEICNEAVEVWSGELVEFDSYSDEEVYYPIGIKEYECIYFVWALEYDDIGYWLDEKSALSYAQLNWDNIRDSSSEED